MPADSEPQARALRMAQAGKTLTYVENMCGVTRDRLIELGAEIGLRFDAKTNTLTSRPAGLDRSDEPSPALDITRDGKHTYANPTEVPRRLTSPPPSAHNPSVKGGTLAVPETSGAGQLLAATANSTDKIVIRIRARIVADLATLAERVVATSAEEARRRQAERERAILESRRTAALAELQEINEKLGVKTKYTKPSVRVPGAQSEAMQRRAESYKARIEACGGRENLRAWCLEHGLDEMPSVGIIANRFFEAYELDHATRPEPAVAATG